ncbi:MAG: isoleucine--tRNA ligase [Candidatus Micrarchaeota archaeon]|nr:isoleucine--tRNA ligase [Candidatus Micrarchaeota archaeon]
MYDHREIEKTISEFWEQKKIYQKSKKKNAEGKTFYFCDGPPYATGQIHPGTGWNKTIKDAVCRYWRMSGYNVRAQPGFDTHGLPIEVKVEQELKLKHKNEIEEKVGIDEFTKRCKEFATKYIDIMGKQFQSLGVWMDFENPYVTYKDDYIDSSWKTLKMAWDQKLMHEGIYVLPYCYRCETTIANYELEYADETDPSIYIKFKVKGTDNDYLLIWTTTPWTLVANMGVMVHPTLPYVKVKVDNETFVVAKARLEHFLSMVGKSGTVLEELSGKKLEGKQYEHPFQDKIKKQSDRKILLSDEFVTVEDGTGLVHSAPGHGPEDFIIGKRYGIEPFCPVDEHGNYTAEAGEFFEGKNVKKMNPEILQMLDEIGVLVHQEKIKHRYPHCWRCKTPLIFIATNQWFITISKIKDKMLEEIEKTEWHPDFAKVRFKEFVSGAPDWCISRQRYWGIPLPIWKCEKCEKVKVIGSRGELGKEKIKELHRPYIDKIELDCDCTGKMKRIPDVLDVWFDSGNAVWASQTEEDAKKFGERADLIIEGQDQIRGWFYSLLGSGLVRYGACPYKKILMHGFFVDEKGEKMSKSLGNFIPLEQILEKYGADSFRLWGSSNTVWEELKFNWEEMKKANSDLNIASNMAVFLERFYPKKKIVSDGLTFEPEDEWLLSRLHSTTKQFKESFEKYEINQAAKAVRSFITDDISRFYMKVAKDRIGRDVNADAALYTIYTSVLGSLKMLSVFSPFMTEHLYLQFFKKFEKEESINLLEFDQVDESDISLLKEKQVEIVKVLTSAALFARQTAKIKLRWPVRTLYIATKSQEMTEAINAFSGIIKTIVNVKDVQVAAEKPSVDVAEQAFENGVAYIPTAVDAELYEEGVVNEVKRRIQNARKTLGLVEKDKIEVSIFGEDELVGIVVKNKAGLLKDVNASSLKVEAGTDAEDFEIDGKVVKISVAKATSPIVRSNRTMDHK